MVVGRANPRARAVSGARQSPQGATQPRVASSSVSVLWLLRPSYIIVAKSEVACDAGLCPGAWWPLGPAWPVPVAPQRSGSLIKNLRSGLFFKTICSSVGASSRKAAPHRHQVDQEPGASPPKSPSVPTMTKVSWPRATLLTSLSNTLTPSCSSRRRPSCSCVLAAIAWRRIKDARTLTKPGKSVVTCQ